MNVYNSNVPYLNIIADIDGPSSHLRFGPVPEYPLRARQACCCKLIAQKQGGAGGRAAKQTDTGDGTPSGGTGVVRWLAIRHPSFVAAAAVTSRHVTSFADPPVAGHFGNPALPLLHIGQFLIRRPGSSAVPQTLVSFMPACLL